MRWHHNLQRKHHFCYMYHMTLCSVQRQKWNDLLQQQNIVWVWPLVFFFYTMGVYGNLQALPLSLKWPLQEEVGNFRKWITKLRAFCYMRGGERTMFCEYTCLTLYNWIMRLKVWWWVSVPNHRTVLNDMAAGMKCFPHTVALGKLYLTGWNRTYAVFVCICVMCVKS